MATSPRSGVVDADGRVFDVENLYNASRSLTPTASSNFPTQTICALAIRMADHLAARQLPFPQG